ncbi:MAG TPA: transglutaminase-like domain-containing protein [Phycisphaerae bacterium]|nr:transglutaminase-like domain-containing protein [Phycisphaerae bacterium]
MSLTRHLLPLALCLITLPALADSPAPNFTEKRLHVDAFDQCSYNALASALLYHTRSFPPSPADRAAFENKTFQTPLQSVGLNAYYGWGPWTSYTINSGKLSWPHADNAPDAASLHAENFSLATKTLPTVKDNSVLVTYAPGERDALRQRLLQNLHRGPIILWTPYGAYLDARNPAHQWHHVTWNADTATVPFDPSFTHSVTLFARPGDDHILVTDCSVRRGTFVTDADTILATAAAISASIRLPDFNGSSIFTRGLKGITDDRFEVVIYPNKDVSPASTNPASTDNDTLALVSSDERPALEHALSLAAECRSQWLDALRDAPPEQRDALAFLIAGMPACDLRTLSKDFILENLRLAFAARAAAPWSHDIPEEIFRDAILPYANVNEKREPWRRSLAQQAAPLIAGCRTPSEAALALNAKLFPLVNVQYHPTKRPKPDQCPSESIAAGYASCTGLSILLVDACRSVGIPARVVGTPGWVLPRGDANGNHAGNHTWVEIWDGRWHVLGASEISPLDHTWFLDNAKLAVTSTDPMHHIYAATWRPSGTFFPLAWDDGDHSVNAADITPDYANPPSPVVPEK